MPFVPLNPNEQERFKPPCTDREHYPPDMIVITEPCKWVCPSCGRESVVYPTKVIC